MQEGLVIRQQNAVVLIFMLVLAACRLDPNELFIQGAWEIAITDQDNRFFQWGFNNGAFTREQRIDQSTHLYTTGRYRVLKSERDAITLELYDIQGDRISYENNPMSMLIEIDRDDESIQITNDKFIRAGRSRFEP